LCFYAAKYHFIISSSFLHPHSAFSFSSNAFVSVSSKPHVKSA
jgi:hypothetical protein